MKKLITAILALVFLLTFSVPALAISLPDKDGWYSTPVLEDGATWLTVDILDTEGPRPAGFRTYFGIMNGRIVATNELLFETGSTFSVRLLNPNDPAYEDAYNKLDNQARKNFGRDILFFEVKITREDGSEYADLQELSDLFIRGRYNVIGLDEGTDEAMMTTVKILFPGWLNAPEEGEYTLCRLSHLDRTYRLISADADLYSAVSVENDGGYPSPGLDDHTGSVLSKGYPEIVYGIGGLAVGFFAAAFIFRKKKAAANGADSADK